MSDTYFIKRIDEDLYYSKIEQRANNGKGTIRGTPSFKDTPMFSDINFALSILFKIRTITDTPYHLYRVESTLVNIDISFGIDVKQTEVIEIG